MARSRNIKPGFFSNELLGTYDPIVCLTFAGLWCLADKDGRMEDRPMRIKAELFPYREGLDVNGYLTVLERGGFIERYSVDGVGYIQVVSFTKHQSPHHTERPKGYPANTKQNQATQAECVLTPLSNRELTVPTRSDSLIPDSLIPDSLIPDSLIPDSLIHGFTDTQNKSAAPPVADAPPLGKPKASRAKSQKTTLDDWLTALGEHDAIPATDPLLVELEAAGVPDDFVALAWAVFKRDWAKKTAVDWRATFRDAIRRGWIRLWYFDTATGECRLNSTGEQSRRMLAHG